MPPPQLFRWYFENFHSLLPFYFIVTYYPFQDTHSHLQDCLVWGQPQNHWRMRRLFNLFDILLELGWLPQIGRFSINSLCESAGVKLALGISYTMSTIDYITYNPPNMGYYLWNRLGRKWSISVVLILGIFDLKSVHTLA